MQHRIIQDSAGHCRKVQDHTGQYKTVQDNTGQCMTVHERLQWILKDNTENFKSLSEEGVSQYIWYL